MNNKIIKLKIFFLITLFAVPTVSFALADVGLNALVKDIIYTINRLFPVLTGLAILAFMWSLIVYIYNAHDPKKREEMRGYMVWSVVALVLIVGVAAVVNILLGVFGLGQGYGNLLPTRLPEEQ